MADYQFKTRFDPASLVVGSAGPVNAVRVRLCLVRHRIVNGYTKFPAIQFCQVTVESESAQTISFHAALVQHFEGDNADSACGTAPNAV